MSTSGQPELKRRRLFAGAGTAAALATTAVVLPVIKPADDTPAAEPKPAPDKGGGYQLSEHVQRYYQTTKV